MPGARRTLTGAMHPIRVDSELLHGAIAAGSDLAGQISGMRGVLDGAHGAASAAGAPGAAEAIGGACTGWCESRRAGEDGGRSIEALDAAGAWWLLTASGAEVELVPVQAERIFRGVARLLPHGSHSD